MQITVAIDQAECIRRGIDAPHSTVKLNINPADLTQEERDFIARQLYDGHDLTRASLSNGFRTMKSLYSPDMDGLRDAIARSIAYFAEKDRKSEAEREQNRLDAERRIEEEMENPTKEKWTVYVDKHGDLQCVRGFFMSHCWGKELVEAPVPRVHSLEQSSPEMRKRFESFRSESALTLKRMIEEAKDRLQPVANEVKAKAEKAKARRKSEFDRLYQELPHLLRERREEGYATDDEVSDAMSYLLRSKLSDALGVGLKADHGGVDSDEAESMGDLEWKVFKTLRARCQGVPAFVAECKFPMPCDVDCRPYEITVKDGSSHGWDDDEEECEPKTELWFMVFASFAGLDLEFWVPYWGVNAGGGE